MELVTTHVNSDFDALASMVAAAFLYPGALRMVPSQVQPAVREFLAVHWDLLRLRTRRSVDPHQVRRLIVTDTASWERLDDLRALAGCPELETLVWDHHPGPGSIQATELHHAEVGAAVTLLLERMQAQDCAFPPMHATLFLLGIYDDTGALTFPSTTARDARMAAFLLENGADLNLVAAYLDSALDDRHLELFQRMLADTEIVERGGIRVGVCVQDADQRLNLLSRVVGKFQEIKGLDAAFGVFPLTPAKTVVVGRGNPRRFDVGQAVRRLGGGGHAGAGSAVVRAPAAEVHARLTALIGDIAQAPVAVGELMSALEFSLSPRQTLREAAALLERARRQTLLVLDDQGRPLGLLGEEQLARIQDDAVWGHPVAALMRHDLVTLQPEQPLREALRLMSQAGIGALPVVVAGRVTGELTRAAVILNLYDF